MPGSKGFSIPKSKTQQKRRKNCPDDLKTADEFEKKSKTKEITKKASVNDVSTYTAAVKSIPCSISSGARGNSKVINNNPNSLPGKIRSELRKDNNTNGVKAKKVKAPSKNINRVTPESKSNKKQFLKNEDEEGDCNYEGGKDNKDINLGVSTDMGKTCYITTDINKDVRKKFCEQLLATKSIKYIVNNKEFKNPKYKPSNLPATAFMKNSSLNRYSDVKCIDQTRVKLKRNLVGLKTKRITKSITSDEKSTSQENDYIHANYVKVPNSDFTYICCQGPMENTLDDHWLMCWQENVKVIVMLCEVIEDNEEKCHKYWPDLMTKKAYGGIIVANEKEDTNKYTNVVIRTLKVQLGDVKRTVVQYHMRSWPDRLIPTGTPIICCLLREVQLVSGLNPTVVHCSAGIGRTGTFMGVHYISEKFKMTTDGNIDILETIKEMREQRLQTVQSTIQFGYLHICLLQYFCEENVFEYTNDVKEFISKSVNTIHEYALRLVKKNKARETEIKEK